MNLTLGTWQIAINRIQATEPEVATMYDFDTLYWHQAIASLGYLRAYQMLFEHLHVNDLFHDLPQRPNILDCGIGTAGLSLSLMQILGSNIQLAGVDVSPQMLRQAQRRLTRLGLICDTQRQSVEALTFTDASFDFVMSAHMLEHVAYPERAIHQMVRVLRPGRPILIIVSKPSALTSLIQLRWRYNAYEPEHLISLLQEKGLGGVQHYPLFGFVPSRTSWAYVGIKPI